MAIDTTSSSSSSSLSYNYSFCHRTLVILTLLFATIFGIIIKVSTIPNDVQIRLLVDEDDGDGSTITQTQTPTIRTLTDDEIENYQRDGFVVIKKLLSNTNDVLRLRDEATLTINKSSVISIFDLLATHRYSKVVYDLWRTNEYIATFVLKTLPKHVVSKIMVVVSSQDVVDTINNKVEIAAGKPSETTEIFVDNKNGIRLLRDAYFKFTTGQIGCDWHVDDPAFWPTEEDSTGLTVWIALDDMSIANGGGIAIANMTLMRNTKFNNDKDDDNDNNMETKCRNAVKYDTCGIQTTCPECYEYLESIKLEWDLTAGDAILWDRWTFHKSVPVVVTSKVTDEVKRDDSSTNDDESSSSSLLLRRYSIRYIPQHAKAFGIVHHSVTQNEEFHSPYYPQVWPHLIKEEMLALQNGLDNDVSIGEILQVIPKFVVANIKKIISTKLLN